MTPVTPSTSQLPGPGKSTASVGHMAKAAVGAARTAGVSLPKNGQGLAASQVASGADPASVFAAQVAALDPEATAPEPAPEAISAYQFNAPAIAVQLLEPSASTAP